MVQFILALAIVADVGGQVRNAVSGEPIAGVAVTALGGGASVRTDSAGRFRLATTATTRLRFTRAGFDPVYFRGRSTEFMAWFRAEYPTGVRWRIPGETKATLLSLERAGFDAEHEVYSGGAGHRWETWVLAVRPWLPTALLPKTDLPSTENTSLALSALPRPMPVVPIPANAWVAVVTST